MAEFERESYGAKLEALSSAQRDGRLDPSFAPADLLALTMSIAAAWFSASEAIRGFDSDDPMSRPRLEQFRRAAVDAATRLVNPAGRGK